MNDRILNSTKRTQLRNCQQGEGVLSIALPKAIFRITLFLLLVSLSAGPLQLVRAQDKPHRAVKNYPIDRQKLEHLQRWVDAGHDTWCRHSDMVAAAALGRLAPDFDSFEYRPASAKVERKKGASAQTTYTYYSLDGQKSYRITVRRYRSLHPASGFVDESIWVPVRSEIIIRSLTD